MRRFMRLSPMRLSFFCLPLFLAACSILGGGAPALLTEVEYGTYRNGVRVAQTDGVPRELGLSFGYRVMVAKEAKSPVKARIVTVTPGLIAPSESKTLTEYLNEATLEPGKTYDVFFTFAEPWQMATGRWEIRVEPAQADPLTRAFDVYNPGRQ